MENSDVGMEYEFKLTYSLFIVMPLLCDHKKGQINIQADLLRPSLGLPCPISCSGGCHGLWSHDCHWKAEEEVQCNNCRER